MDDIVETLFLNLFNGSKLKAMTAGPKPKENAHEPQTPGFPA